MCKLFVINRKKEFSKFVIFSISSKRFIVEIAQVNPYYFCLASFWDTAQKMKFSIKDFFSKCDQIRSFLGICSHLVNKYLIENFFFCTVGIRTFVLFSLSYNRSKLSVKLLNVKTFCSVNRNVPYI